MNKVVTKITESEYVEKYNYFQEVTSLSSDEDIATLLNTFKTSKLKGYNVVKILEDNGKYIFVYSNEDTGFDFFEEINKLNRTGIKVSCTNANVQYPDSKSRGYFVVSDEVDIPKKEYNTGHVDEYNDDAPTGFMGDDDLKDLGVNAILIHMNTGSRLPINDSHGVLIGRSSQLSEYIVPNSKVSRKHARVYKSGNKIMVHDFNSANGTTIDGLKVAPELDRELPIGSVLMLANEEFKLV